METHNPLLRDALVQVMRFARQRTSGNAASVYYTALDDIDGWFTGVGHGGAIKDEMIRQQSLIDEMSNEQHSSYTKYPFPFRLSVRDGMLIFVLFKPSV